MKLVTKHSPLGARGASWLPRRWSILLAGLLCGTAAGCGASARSTSTRADARPRPALAASRVCRHASRSAAALLAVPVKTSISDSNPTNIQCVVSGAGISVDVGAQASAQAWEIYDATTVQQTQAYAWGTAHAQKELPRALALDAFSADWIPAVDEMVATNGTQTRGGSYVTVTVTRAGRRASKRRPSSMGLALAITRATLASAPRGSSPAPSAWP